MLIPIGFFGAGGAAGAYELISTVTVSGGSPTLINFTSIPQTYKHLQIRMTARTDRAATSDQIFFPQAARVHFLLGNGSAVSSGTDAATQLIGNVPGNTATANTFASMIVDIFDYTSTTKNKTIRALFGSSSSVNEIRLTSGIIVNTAALTSFQMYPNYGSLVNGSRASLYGIKG